MPAVIIEVLACGMPVVSTDAPYGLRENLGRWGDLPPVGDAPALAPVATLRARRRPSPERAVDAYLALFEKLVRH